MRPAQARGLAPWVDGRLSGGSACQAAVIGEGLAAGSGAAAVRQRRRAFRWDGPDQAVPCTTPVDVPACFAPLLPWVLDWWPDGRPLPLAVDATHLGDASGRRIWATHLGDDRALLVVSVVSRGSAIPVAWHSGATAPTGPGQARDSWTAALLRLLARLRPAVPRRRPGLVLRDQGRRSPRLRHAICAAGWHPLMRVPRDTGVRPAGAADFVPAQTLVPLPGDGWVGRATVSKQRRRQGEATLAVSGDCGQPALWVVLTDLPPRTLGAVWSALRSWIALGVRARKGGAGRGSGPAAPTRGGWHATGWWWRSRCAGRSPSAPAPRLPARPPPRRTSIVRRGRALRHRALVRGRRWTCRWRAPEPWPDPRPSLPIGSHDAPTQPQPP